MIRLLFTLALLFAFDTYVFEAFKTISLNWSEPGKSVVWSLYWSIPLLLIGFFLSLNFGAESKWLKKNLALIRSSITLTYFSKFLIFLSLLIEDLSHLLFQLFNLIVGNQNLLYERSIVFSSVGIGLGATAFFLLIYGMIRNPYRYKVFREEVKLDNLPAILKGLKIVQISDIHSGSFTKKEPIKKAIEMINKEKADFVFFTGDLVNSVANEVEPFLDVFDKIESRFGTFSILGNHDYGDYARWNTLEDKKSNFQNLQNMHKRMGWDLMMNENRLVDVDGEQVAIIGVENYSASKRFSKYGDLSLAYDGAENAAVKLLLSHDPSHWEDEVLSKYKDINITFSGHTHGAQFGIEIPGWLKWSPIKYIYKQWAGLYKEGRQYLYVNRGFGFLGYPGRVGILPEITVIELGSK